MLNTARKKTLQQIELAVSGTISGKLRGEFRGALPGLGSEAGDTRIYNSGDDVRLIDWSATARAQKIYVREIVAEHELSVILVIEGSNSIHFGTHSISKLELFAAATLAFSIVVGKSKNRLGAILVSPDKIEIIPPTSKSNTSTVLFNKVSNMSPSSGKLDMVKALKVVSTLEPRRCFVVIISDLIGSEKWLEHLNSLASTHDTLVCEITDPRDLALVNVGPLSLQDCSTGKEVFINTSNKKLLKVINSEITRKRELNYRTIKKTPADFMSLTTSEDWMKPLLDYFRQRSLRVRTGEKK